MVVQIPSVNKNSGKTGLLLQKLPVVVITACVLYFIKIKGRGERTDINPASVTHRFFQYQSPGDIKQQDSAATKLPLTENEITSVAGLG